MKNKINPAYTIWVMCGIFPHGTVCLDRRHHWEESMSTPSIELTEDQWAKIQKDTAGNHMLTKDEPEKPTLLSTAYNTHA